MSTEEKAGQFLGFCCFVLELQPEICFGLLSMSKMDLLMIGLKGLLVFDDSASLCKWYFSIFDRVPFGGVDSAFQGFHGTFLAFL